jgi:hypothetical protein
MLGADLGCGLGIATTKGMLALQGGGARHRGRSPQKLGPQPQSGRFSPYDVSTLLS